MMPLPTLTPRAQEKYKLVQTHALATGKSLHESLHYLWSRDNGPDYDKASWLEVDAVTPGPALKGQRS